jgi:hypothetical protein
MTNSETIKIGEMSAERSNDAGKSEHRRHELEVHVRRLESDHRHPLRLPSDAPLLDVLDKGAEILHEKLLPNKEEPLDELRHLDKFGHPGPAIKDLQESVGTFLSGHDISHDFAIEFVLAIRVNAYWKVAPEKKMTPKQILMLFGLKFEEYSLYRGRSADLLPLDTPLELHRGEAFEAQRDGKYGEGR